VETVSLQTLDGLVLEADLARADEAITPTAAWVVCHPHPLYGGDRHNIVVQNIISSVIKRHGIALAPDFRGVGNSEGAHDGEGAERLDVEAAIGFLSVTAPDAPIIVAGYSFGAATCLNVGDPRAHCWAAVAPPVSMMIGECVARGDHRKSHVLMPAHDQFSSLDATHNEFSRWKNVDLQIAETADHFMAGQADELDALVHRVQSSLA
jgi:alpha/beta superfamily hydrolase